MHRREYLATVAVGGVGTTAGCLGGLFDSGPESVVLGEPSDQRAESTALAYPAYGEAFPEFSLPNAFADEPFESTAVDVPALYTAFYAFCPAECILLMGSMGNIQAELDRRELLESVRMVGITFDPERDTPEELADHGDQMGINHSHESWQYLRPEDDEQATEVVNDRLGIGFEKVSAPGEEAYDFNHVTVTVLVNPDGVVERAYRGDEPEVERVVDDFETVVAAYE